VSISGRVDFGRVDFGRVDFAALDFVPRDPAVRGGLQRAPRLCKE
jgi:hypothetical protein